jgi:hypothetical protein
MGPKQKAAVKAVIAKRLKETQQLMETLYESLADPDSVYGLCIKAGCDKSDARYIANRYRKYFCGKQRLIKDVVFVVPIRMKKP